MKKYTNKTTTKKTTTTRTAVKKAYMHYHYSRPYVLKTTHMTAEKLSKKLGVPFTQVYARAVTLLAAKAK